jgi:hypothetical protein
LFGSRASSCCSRVVRHRRGSAARSAAHGTNSPYAALPGTSAFGGRTTVAPRTTAMPHEAVARTPIRLLIARQDFGSDSMAKLLISTGIPPTSAVDRPLIRAE